MSKVAHTNRTDHPLFCTSKPPFTLPLTPQIEVDNPLPNAGAHIPNIGRLVEDME
jgi:hypothetical protein